MELVRQVSRTIRTCNIKLEIDETRSRTIKSRLKSASFARMWRSEPRSLKVAVSSLKIRSSEKRSRILKGSSRFYHWRTNCGSRRIIAAFVGWQLSVIDEKRTSDRGEAVGSSIDRSGYNQRARQRLKVCSHWEASRESSCYCNQDEVSVWICTNEYDF